MKQAIAVFPGSFDPLTIGHVSIVQRALPLFSKVVVAMGVNNTKRSLFPKEQRLEWLKAAFKNEPRIEVTSFEGLTIDLCQRVGARFILRGLRNASDHDYERSIAIINHQLGQVETVFLPAEPHHAHISSTIVRELYANNADVSAFVPMDLRRS